MSRCALSLGLLTLVVACGSEPRAPSATAGPIALPPIPVAAPSETTVPEIPCDERDPTPDALPTTPPPPAFTLLDTEIRQLQNQPGKYVYSGTVTDVMGDGRGKKGAFAIDAEEAMAYGRRLEREVVEKYESAEWAVVALTREAEMFERLRDGLANTVVYAGPGPTPTGQLALLSPPQLNLFARLQSGGLVAKAASLHAALLDLWNEKKQQEMDGADARIIGCYARAAVFADSKNPAATRAVRRLAGYTSKIGDAEMASILGRAYVPGMYRAACARLSELLSN